MQDPALLRERQGTRLEHRVVERLRERCFRALMAAIITLIGVIRLIGRGLRNVTAFR